MEASSCGSGWRRCWTDGSDASGDIVPGSWNGFRQHCPASGEHSVPASIIGLHEASHIFATLFVFLFFLVGWVNDPEVIELVA